MRWSNGAAAGLALLLGSGTPGAESAPPSAFHTVEAAEADGAAHPRAVARALRQPSLDASWQKLVAEVAGTADRRCVETGSHPSVRSGDIIAGAFHVRAMMMALPPLERPQRKLWWAPVGPSGADLVIRAGKIDTPGMTATLSLGPNNDPDVFFPSGVRFVEAGRWLLVVTSGSNWGCFIYDEV